MSAHPSSLRLRRTAHTYAMTMLVMEANGIDHGNHRGYMVHDQIADDMDRGWAAFDRAMARVAYPSSTIVRMEMPK